MEAPHACSSLLLCVRDVGHDGVKHLMKYILFFQVRDNMQHTLQLLDHHCTSAPNPIHDAPYVLVIACAYIDAVAAAGCSDGIPEFDSLLKSVSSICGHQTQNLSIGDFHRDSRRWDGLESALEYIRDNHTEPVLTTSKHEPLDNSDLPIVHQYIKAPDHV